MNNYNEIVSKVLFLHESIDKKKLNQDTYLYSIKIYKRKLFENIKKTKNSIYIQNYTNIYETLFNIVILTLNFLQIQDPTKTHISITNENRNYLKKIMIMVIHLKILN